MLGRAKKEGSEQEQEVEGQSERATQLPPSIASPGIDDSLTNRYREDPVRLG